MKVTIDITDNQTRPMSGFLNAPLSIDQLVLDKYYLIAVKTPSEIPEGYLTTANDFFEEKRLIEEWKRRNNVVYQSGHLKHIRLVKIIGYSDQGFPIGLLSEGKSQPLATIPDEYFNRLIKH